MISRSDGCLIMIVPVYKRSPCLRSHREVKMLRTRGNNCSKHYQWLRVSKGKISKSRDERSLVERDTILIGSGRSQSITRKKSFECEEKKTRVQLVSGRLVVNYRKYGRLNFMFWAQTPVLW